MTDYTKTDMPQELVEAKLTRCARAMSRKIGEKAAIVDQHGALMCVEDLTVNGKRYIVTMKMEPLNIEPVGA